MPVSLIRMVCGVNADMSVLRQQPHFCPHRQKLNRRKVRKSMRRWRALRDSNSRPSDS